MAAARQAFAQGMQLSVTLSATVAVIVAVMATILLRAVPVPVQAGGQPAAPPPPAATTGPQEQPVQIIRAGSGCIACPAQPQPSDAQDTAA